MVSLLITLLISLTTPQSDTQTTSTSTTSTNQTISTFGGASTWNEATD